MQANPNALVPFPANSNYSDPTFEECFAATCFKTWGLRVYNTTNFFSYGVGLYSFFDNYDSGCILTGTCQQNMVDIALSEAIYIYGLNTVAADNLVQVDNTALVPHEANENDFCETVAVFEYP
jgi:glucan 1,3-beta-glucosidase